MDDWQTIRQAALTVGVTRQTVAKWVDLGLLKSRKTKVRNLDAKLVNVAKVRELAETRKPGRPKGATKKEG